LDATTLRKAALGMDGVEPSLPELPVTTEYHYAETVPVFFGHYWLRGTPVISSDYAACLDFSVAKRVLGGRYPNDEFERTGLVRFWSKLTGVRSTNRATGPCEVYEWLSRRSADRRG
jgi:hypothetical protein